MEQSIDSFIRFLAVERGLSDNYQLSTQRSLTEFANWCRARHKIDNARKVTLSILSEYLGERKRGGLSASSIKLIVVALKIFFRYLANKGAIASLLQLVGPSQIVFGTDFPPGGTSAQYAKTLTEIGMFTEGDLRAIDRENAVRLLPRLKG